MNQLKKAFACLLLICTSIMTLAQSKITGKVTDTDGEPIIGASIVAKGAGNGAITDANGDFSLNVTSGTLVISYIGYVTNEIPINGQFFFKIILKRNTNALDEVVVTALGMKRSAKALGYAMTELKGDELFTNSNNPIDVLQGRVAGLDISGSDGGMFGSDKIQLRGAPTLNGTNRPVFVIDNVILSNDNATAGDADWSADADDWGNELKNLNPNDFETVSVLKGAAATALYGSRGMYGAIVITTKNGKGTKGFGVTINQTFGMDCVYKQPDLQNVYGTGIMAGYVDYGETDANGNYYAFDNQHQFKLNANGQPMFNDWYNIGTGYGPPFDGRTILGYDNEPTAYKAIKNNYKNIYNSGFSTTTNAVVQGGNEATTFYTSLSYKHQNGTLPNNEFDRLALLAKASHKISNSVLLNASVNFAKSDPKNPQPNIGEYFNNGAFAREYNPSYYRTKYTGAGGGLANTAYGDKYGNVPGTSLWWSLYNNSITQEELSFRPDLTLTVNMTDWLKFKAEANYNYYYTNRETKDPNYGYAGTYQNGAGMYEITQTMKRQTNADANFLWDKKFNADWSLTGFLRGEYYDNWQNYTDSQTSGGLVVPDHYFLANSVNVPITQAYTLGTKRMVSVAGQVGLGWKDRIYVDVTGRNDWSSALIYSDGTGNYSYFYPSINGSFILSDVLELPKWISFAKVRLSWAQTGNDTDPYSINSAYTLNTTVMGDNYIRSLQLGTMLVSKNLKPERKNSLEGGLDWRFFNNRLGIDATFYKENTKNQIMTVSVPPVSGVSQEIVNAGNIQNAGVELAIHTVPVQHKEWQWNIDFTYTRNVNKIIALHPDVADYILLDGRTNYGNYRIGSVAKVGADYGLLMTDSKPKIDPATGLEVLNWNNGVRAAYAQRSGVEEPIGSMNPDFLGSVYTTLRYKKLQLKIGLNARFGGYVASYNARYGTAYGFTTSSLAHSAPQYGGITWKSAFDGMTYRDGYIPDGIFPADTQIQQPDGSTYTVAAGGETYKSLYQRELIEPTHASTWSYFRNSWSRGVINDVWVRKLNYIALREVTLTYSCPVAFANKLGARTLTVGVTGRSPDYLLNTMPSHENPESLRGTSASAFRYRSFEAFTASYLLNLSASF